MESKATSSPILTVLKSQAFWLALIISIISAMSRAMLRQPVNLLGADLGFSAAALGGIASLYTIMAMISRGPTGGTLDTSKKPNIFLFGMHAFMAVVFLGFAFCSSQTAFVVLRLLHGIAFGMAQMASLAIVGMCIDKRALGSAFGLVVLIPKILSALTNQFTMWLQQTAGVEYCAYIGAAMALICGIFCLFVKVNRSENAIKAAPKKRGLKGMLYYRALPVAIIMMLMQLPSMCCDSFVVLYGHAMDFEAQAGTFITNYSIWMGIGSFAFGYIIDKISTKQAKYIIMAVALVASVSIFMISRSQAAGVWSIAAVLTGLAAGGAFLPRTITVRESSQAVAGLAVGTFAAMQDLGNILFNAPMGALADAAGYPALFAALAICPLIAIVLVLFGFEKFLGLLKVEGKEEA